MRRNLLLLGTLVTATAGILALVPGVVVASDLGTGIGDKPAHGVIAALCTVLLVLGAPRQPAAMPGILLVVALGAGLVELMQPLVGRAASWQDWLFGVLGGVLGVGLCRLFMPRPAAAVRGAPRGSDGTRPPRAAL